MTASEQQPQEIESQQTEQIEQPQPQSIVVDVKGAVQHPGVYPFTTENRIIDAIQAAGGYSEKADTRFINHAQKLSDELVIYVPVIGEGIEQPATVVMSGGTTSTASSGQEETVNINSATEAELTTLPGIGPSKAAAIIAYREENGQFASVEDLKNVSGIGDKTFEQLQQLIAVK